MSYIEADMHRDNKDRVFIQWRDGNIIHKEWQGERDIDIYPDEAAAKVEYAERERRIRERGFVFIGHKPVMEYTPFAAMEPAIPPCVQSGKLKIVALKRRTRVE